MHSIDIIMFKSNHLDGCTRLFSCLLRLSAMLNSLPYQFLKETPVVIIMAYLTIDSEWNMR